MVRSSWSPSEGNFVAGQIIAAARVSPLHIGSFRLTSFWFVAADPVRLGAAPSHHVQAGAGLAVAIDPGVGGDGALDVDVGIFFETIGEKFDEVPAAPSAVGLFLRGMCHRATDPEARVPGSKRCAPMNAAMSSRRYHTERPILTNAGPCRLQRHAVKVCAFTPSSPAVASLLTNSSGATEARAPFMGAEARRSDLRCAILFSPHQLK
jgi:hypothetical protein